MPLGGYRICATWQEPAIPSLDGAGSPGVGFETTVHAVHATGVALAEGVAEAVLLACEVGDPVGFAVPPQAVRKPSTTRGRYFKTRMRATIQQWAAIWD